jgi:hypothetical protein
MQHPYYRIWTQMVGSKRRSLEDRKSDSPGIRVLDARRSKVTEGVPKIARPAPLEAESWMWEARHYLEVKDP